MIAVEGEGNGSRHVEGRNEGAGDGDPHHEGVALGAQGGENLVFRPEAGQGEDPRQGQ